VEQFIKLGLHGLSIAVLCALNEQGHELNGHGSEAMPTKRLAIEQELQGAVGHDEQECPRVGGKDTKLSEGTAN
jgi:hypothetical protein